MPDGKFLISFRFHFENRYKELERDRKAEAIYTARLALIRPCINKNGQLAWPAAWKPNRQPASLFYLIRRKSSILFWLFFHFFFMERANRRWFDSSSSSPYISSADGSERQTTRRQCRLICLLSIAARAKFHTSWRSASIVLLICHSFDTFSTASSCH